MGKGERHQLGIKSKEAQGQIAGSHSVKYNPVGKGFLALGEKKEYATTQSAGRFSPSCQNARIRPARIALNGCDEVSLELHTGGGEE